jgi:hypothetical protein
LSSHSRLEQLQGQEEFEEERVYLAEVHKICFGSDRKKNNNVVDPDR